MRRVAVLGQREAPLQVGDVPFEDVAQQARVEHHALEGHMGAGLDRTPRVGRADSRTTMSDDVVFGILCGLQRAGVIDRLGRLEAFDELEAVAGARMPLLPDDDPHQVDRIRGQTTSRESDRSELHAVAESVDGALELLIDVDVRQALPFIGRPDPPYGRTAEAEQAGVVLCVGSVAGNAPDRFLAPSSQVEHAGIAARDRRHTVRRLRNAGSTSTSTSFAQPGARRAARSLALAQNVADREQRPPGRRASIRPLLGAAWSYRHHMTGR